MEKDLYTMLGETLLELYLASAERPAINSMRLGLQVESLSQCVSELQQLEFVNVPTEIEDKNSIVIEDPDGYQIEVAN